jgi:hypothetical protein
VKKTKKKKPEVAPVPTPDETDMPPPAKGGYNLDFLDNLDDPNLDPFATKTKVQNDNEDAPLPAKGAYQVDFDKFDDPNFNPFETKTKIQDSDPVSSTPISGGKPLVEV